MQRTTLTNPITLIRLKTTYCADKRVDNLCGIQMSTRIINGGPGLISLALGNASCVLNQMDTRPVI